MVEVGLEVLVISLSALLWGASLNCRRDANPVVCSMDVDQVKEELILLLAPRASLVLRHCKRVTVGFKGQRSCWKLAEGSTATACVVRGRRCEDVWTDL